MPTLLGVLGSVTPPGRLSSALQWTLDAAQAAQPGLSAAMLDLGAYKVGFADGRPLDQLDDDTPKVVQMALDADAVLFATPVYRATYTGALKNYLDLLPIEALMNKACGVIAMGATQHHYLGADWHLRDVLTWFGAVTPPNSVYLASSDFEQGQLVDSAKESLSALAASVLRLQAMLADGAPLGPTPLAARR